jgi:hypothetical protein
MNTSAIHNSYLINRLPSKTLGATLVHAPMVQSPNSVPAHTVSTPVPDGPQDPPVSHLTLQRSMCLTSHIRLGNNILLSLVLLCRTSYRRWSFMLLPHQVLLGLALGCKTTFQRSKTSGRISYGMIPRSADFWLVLHLQLQRTASPYHTLLPFSHHIGSRP